MWTRLHGDSVTTMIRVVLADDQVLVRAGFGALLAAEDDIEVAGEAADGREAVQLAQRVKPDVVLMDIRMPVLDGIEATRRIAAEPGLGATHVVILTTFDLDEYVFEGIRAGAAGFLVKDTDPSELIRAVRVVAGGEALLSPKITLRLISEYASRSRSVRRVPGLTSLTGREREVVTLVAGGLSNEEIADKLYLSVSTAKTHATRAMAKLGARDRAQLVVIAYESGLVRPGWTDLPAPEAAEPASSPAAGRYQPTADDRGPDPCHDAGDKQTRENERKRDIR
jgi:DNA-binding NarL/FixJ family response regulator